MNKKILVIAFVFAFAIVGFVLMSKAVSATMSAEDCYQLADNKDKALENMSSLELQGSYSAINPCTGLWDTYLSYRNLNGNSITNIRRLYSTGDAEGYIGSTHYWVCRSNDTAEVHQRIYGPIPNRGWGWGFYHNFPFDDIPSTWVKDKEICNTME